MAHLNNATMKDIARSMNVSVTTISKVINGHKDISDKTRQEVLDKIVEMGYVPNIMAANLRRSKANMVALVLSDISKPYFSRVISGYESTLGAAGYQTMTFSSMEQGDRENRFIRQIASMNMAGIIIDPAQNSDPEKSALKQAGMRICSLRRPSIASQRQSAARRGAGALLPHNRFKNMKGNG